MGQFKYNPKMDSTEESVVLKLKKGGTVKKAEGGALPIRNEGRIMGAKAPALAAQMAQGRGRAAMMGSPAMRQPAPGIPAQAMGKKKGGEVESKAMQMKEDREIKGIKKELKSHEAKSASKAHKGLKTGGVVDKDGSKTGSVEQFRGGYKKGGKIACKSGGGMMTDKEAALAKLAPGALTDATRAMGEKVRPYSSPMLMRDESKPSPTEMEAMRRELADQKQDMATEEGYRRAIGKKTGGVMKKYADGGHCAMKSGGEAGFKATKKGGCW